MSDAAVRHVKTCTHPQVKGATLALLQAIAELVPEGQTATAPLTLQDLATAARHTTRTVQTGRNLLNAIGWIRMHDGGRGKVASYEIVHLEGQRPITAAPLPLRADLREAAPRQAKDVRTPDLFDEGDELASNIGSDVPNVGSYVVPIGEGTAINVGSFFLRSLTVLQNVGNFFLRLAPRTIRRRKRSDPMLAPIDVDLVSARARLSSSYEDLEVVGDTRARELADAADRFMAWFEATYPTVHHGAACTVDRTRDGPLVRELLQRPRTDVAHLQAMTRWLWGITTDGVVNSDPWWIAERVTVRNIFVLRRKANFLDGEVRRAALAVDVWSEVLAATEPRVDRLTFHKWFIPLTLVHDGGEVLTVAVPSALHGEWIQKHHADVLAEALRDVRPGARVEFVDIGQRKSG